MWGENGRGLVVLKEVTPWGQSELGRAVVQEERTTQKEKKWSGYRAQRKRERAEDTVCSFVHNIVSRDVTLEIHTCKSQTSLCDNGIKDHKKFFTISKLYIYRKLAKNMKVPLSS